MKAKHSKGDLHNYYDFLDALKSSKNNWDKYIKEECLAQAYLNEEDSFALYTDNNACLIKGYNDRIYFCKNYQFSKRTPFPV